MKHAEQVLLYAFVYDLLVHTVSKRLPTGVAWVSFTRMQGTCLYNPFFVPKYLEHFLQVYLLSGCFSFMCFVISDVEDNFCLQQQQTNCLWRLFLLRRWKLDMFKLPLFVFFNWIYHNIWIFLGAAGVLLQEHKTLDDGGTSIFFFLLFLLELRSFLLLFLCSFFYLL